MFLNLDTTYKSAFTTGSRYITFKNILIIELIHNYWIKYCTKENLKISLDFPLEKCHVPPNHNATMYLKLFFLIDAF